VSQRTRIWLHSLMCRVDGTKTAGLFASLSPLLPKSATVPITCSQEFSNPGAERMMGEQFSRNANLRIARWRRRWGSTFVRACD